jgi:hypothetical protein
VFQTSTRLRGLGPSVGEKQPRADSNDESGTAEPPDVIDLRSPDGAAANGETSPDVDDVAGSDLDLARRLDGRALTASEGWDWLDLDLRISEAQLDARRTTARPMNIDRTDVRVRQPPEGAADPASRHPTSRAWSEWLDLRRTISGAPTVPSPRNGATVSAHGDAVVAVTESPKPADVDEVEPEVAEVADVAEISNVAQVHDAAPLPDTARIDPHRRMPYVSRPLAGALAAAVLVVAVLVVAVLVTVAATNDSPAQRPTATRPAAATAEPTPGVARSAVQWLAENVSADARLLVPPGLVDDIADGLQGRQVLALDDAVARSGDLLVANPDSADLASGSLTQQVVASSPVIARLPGSDLDVRQVIGPDTAVAARASAGSELLQNLGLSFASGSSSALRSGEVDERVLVILAGLAAQHSLTVALTPDPADAPDAPVRTLRIQGVDGHPVTNASAHEIGDFVTAQRGALAGPVVDETGGGATRAISIRYLLPTSVGLLSSGSFPTVPQETP